MRTAWLKVSYFAAAVVLLAGVAASSQTAAGGQGMGGQQAAPGGSPPPDAASVARGEYLVTAMGCHDCHTPWKMGASGPEPDMALALSGHPSDMTLPPPPQPSGPWVGSVTATFTGWAGPWGVSHAANLTPDPETGLGQWTEQQFVQTIRTGRRQGRGREILPPMPWPAFRNLNDADLKAMFAYLRTIKPIRNKVPEPVIASPAD